MAHGFTVVVNHWHSGSRQSIPLRLTNGYPAMGCKEEFFAPKPLWKRLNPETVALVAAIQNGMVKDSMAAGCERVILQRFSL
ncbi:hypothetical protein [Pseudomonas sp. NFX224]|uniref:hypothetical protein n=1 Tax=Pseudomonas sp. NFX224 TaxID=3402862 RepID=UPI003AFAD25E